MDTILQLKAEQLAREMAVSNLNRNRREVFSRRKPLRES